MIDTTPGTVMSEGRRRMVSVGERFEREGRGGGNCFTEVACQSNDGVCRGVIYF